MSKVCFVRAIGYNGREGCVVLEKIQVTDQIEIERRVATALADALIGDPFYAAITIDFAADEIRRRAVLAVYCRYSLQEGYHIGKTVIAKDAAGAAIWNLPQPPDVAERALQAKQSAFEVLLGPRGFEAYRAILNFMEPAAQAVIPPDTWYLSILGVAPQKQGRGVGRTLLAPTLREADQVGARCFLETFNAARLPFYRRLGFEAVADHIEPTTERQYWIMVREAP